MNTSLLRPSVINDPRLTVRAAASRYGLGNLIGAWLLIAAALPASAATTFVWNVSTPGANNWNVNANWLPGTGNPAAGDTALFGVTGTSGAANAVNNVVSVNTTIATLTFTNSSSGAWHVSQIPSGVTLNVTGTTTVSGGGSVNGLVTLAAMVDAGTLALNGNLTIGNNGSSSIDSGTTLDLSGLSNFVYNAASGTIAMGTGARSAAAFLLAGVSNNVTVGTWNDNTPSSSSSGTGNLTLGAGTNIINVGTFNISAGRVSSTVAFPGGSAGGLRLRGVGGTDSDRATIVIGNRNNGGGSGNNITGTFNANGHPIDVKANTISLGMSGSNPSGSANGTGTLNFDTGVIDATNINMAVSSGTTANALATGNITVGTNATLGTNGLLIVGAGGISMANQSGSSGTASGNLTINGGEVRCAGNIRKTTSLGTATITINAGKLNLTALTNTIGSSGVPIDSLSVADSALTLPVFSGSPSAVVSTLAINGLSDTINVTIVPGLGQFPLITYASVLGSPDFSLGTLPAGYQGYVSNNTSASSIDLVITNSLAKTDTWRGNLNGNWDTTSANWFSSGGPSTYVQGDIVIFDDTLTGTPNVILTTGLAPNQVSVSAAANYVFGGSGKLTGTTSLTKSGSGSLTLSESGGDDFSGGITVNNGTLVLDNANSTISGGLSINGGTVRIGNNDANGALPSGAVTDNGALVFARTTAVAVSTPISGSGSLSQSGSGTLTLSGANSYFGNTIVNGGTLALSGAGTVSNSPQVQVSSAGLNVSALPQSLFAGLNLTNSSVTVALNASGNAPMVANTLALGGANNAINVTAIPTIASYPVAFTVIQSANPIDGSFNCTLGTVPAATPAYAGSVSQNGNSVVLTLTAGPTGARPSVFWSGADVPNLNTNWSDRLNWQVPGAPVAGDVVLFNNTASSSSSALSTPGGGLSTFIPDNLNNIVDANFNLSSLTYSNNGGSYHNTYIKSGDTLNITNTGGLTVGGYDVAGTAQQQFVTVSGTGKMVVTNAGGNVNVWSGNANSGGTTRSTLDLSALDTFSATVSRFLVGSSIGNVVNRPSGALYLAKTNTINAGFQTTTSEAGTGTANGALIVGDCNGNAGSQSFLYLGQVNTISADTLLIARQKTAADIRFNPNLRNIAPYPTATIQGFTTSRVSLFSMGDGVGNTGTTTPNGTADFSGGIVNAMIDTLTIARASSAGSAVNLSTGTLGFDAGTIDANTVNVGLQFTNKPAVGNLNVSSNAVIGIGASLIVHSSLNLGVSNYLGAASTSGSLNITNGTVTMNNLAAGAVSNASINLIGGSMSLAAPMSGSLSSLTLSPLGTPDNSSSSLTLAASALPAISTAVLNVDGLTTTTNVINVSSVNVSSFPIEVPLIQYGSFNLVNGNFNIGLGSLPAGTTGYLTNDTASSMIGLVILTAPPKPAYITSFGIQGGNLVASGTNGYAGQTYYIVASTNLALPRHSWPRIATNTFDVNGNFTQTLPLTPAIPARFFSVQVQ